MPSGRRAFTLIELLVVVGIITVLVAILLPVLGRAREQASRVKCLATLRTMAQAAQMHAQEHRGYMPLAGDIYGNLPKWPASLGDLARQKYTYFSDPAPRPAPLSASLGQYLNLPVVLGTRADLEQSLKSEAVFRHFTCPADAHPRVGTTIIFSSAGLGLTGFVGPDETLSYVFNGAVLGTSPNSAHGYLGGRGVMGNVARVRRPATVFLFCDGTGWRLNPIGPYRLFEVGDADDLHESWVRYTSPGVWAEQRAFDPARHRNGLNIVFVDGHAETVVAPEPNHPADLDRRSDLSHVGVFMGVNAVPQM